MIWMGVGLVVLIVSGLFAHPRYGANLGHPIRWRRWLNRALAYPSCHFLAALLVLAGIETWADYSPMTAGLTDYKAHPWLNLLVLPLPLALLLLKICTWMQRAFYGYEDAPAPAPLPEAWVPPPPRRHDFSRLDLRDPELVRELARSHWRVAHEALEQGASTEAAEDLHRRFLVDHLGSVEPGLAEQARRVYCLEMAALAEAAAERAERIEGLREHQLRVLAGEP